MDYGSSAAISVGFAADVDMTHNEIFDIPYSAWHIGYGWNNIFPCNTKNMLLEYNFVHDYMGDGIYDGGGIYVLGNTSGDGYNIARYNYCRNQMNLSGALYADQGTTWFRFQENVVDLSETDNKTQSVREDLTPEDIVNGKLAYVMGFKQLIGKDKYPSPLNAEEVNYVGDAGYATMYDKANDWALNGGATAYIAAALDGNYLQLTEVEDVPAGAAVILKGSYYNKLATTATSDVTANKLFGTDAEMVSDGTQYCLAKYDDTVGFYLVKEGTPIAAGKAYYQSTSGVKAFYFGNGDATSIQTIDNAQKTTEDAIYNIAGQRLNKVQKGINIINGKKVLY